MSSENPSEMRRFLNLENLKLLSMLDKLAKLFEDFGLPVPGMPHEVRFHPVRLRDSDPDRPGIRTGSRRLRSRDVLLEIEPERLPGSRFVEDEEYRHRFLDPQVVIANIQIEDVRPTIRMLYQGLRGFQLD